MQPGCAGSLRIGLGWDFHTFAESGTAILAGQPVPGCPALSGHGDADVLSHAVIDAVLGAAGEVDMGTLYPDTDEAFRNTPGIELARQVRRLVGERGFRIVGLDAVLVCNRSVIAAARPMIRAGLAQAFEIDTGRVNVRGRDTAAGRPQGDPGLEALAVALLASS